MLKLGGKISNYLVSNLFTTKNSLELSGLSFPVMSGIEKATTEIIRESYRLA